MIQLDGVVVGELGPGRVALFAVGGAILVLLAVRVLLRMIRSGVDDAAVVDAVASLQPGQGYCMSCDFTYEVDPDDPVGGCPVCGGDDDLSRESAAADVVEAECPACRELVDATSMRDGLCVSCAADMDGEESAAVECPGCRELVRQDDLVDGMCASCAADMSDRECEVCGVLTDPDEYEENGGSCNACRHAFEVRTSRLGE